MSVRRLCGLMLAIALVLATRPAGAFHTVFDFSVDRFEVDGNRFGPRDGTPDFVDPFDDRSHWYVPYGSATVIDGHLHVHNPGTHFPGPDGTSLDLTEVASEAPALTIGIGLGDAMGTAVFDPIVPPEGHFYHFTLYTYGNGTPYFNELFGVDINTYGGVTHIEQHLIELDLPAGRYETLTVESQPIDPASITKPIHLRVAYDDATSTVVSSFSLDDGATFASPFTPAQIFTDGRTTAQFIIGADPRLTTATTTSTTSASTTSTTATTTSSSLATATTTVPASTTTRPAPTTTSTTLPLGSCRRTDCARAPKNTVELRARGGSQSLAWGWRGGAPVAVEQLGDPRLPGGTRYALCVADGTGAPLFRAELPTCAGGAGCWKTTGDHGLRFKGGAGLRALTITAAGKGGASVVATARGHGLFAATLPPTLPLVVQLEADTGACWSAAFDVPDVATSGAGRFKAATR
jgi:hypothetical protein